MTRLLLVTVILLAVVSSCTGLESALRGKSKRSAHLAKAAAPSGSRTGAPSESKDTQTFRTGAPSESKGTQTSSGAPRKGTQTSSGGAPRKKGVPRRRNKKGNVIVKTVQETGVPRFCKPTGACQKKWDRVVFSFTTIKDRIDAIKPALDSVVTGQSRTPDAVYLSIGPEVKKLPDWLKKYDRSVKKKGVLKVLRQAKDIGPALKMLGAAREELAAGRNNTLIIYGDDDTVYGSDIVQMHMTAQNCSSKHDMAVGPRRIKAGRPEIPVLEAAGSISIRAGAVPCSAFSVGDTVDACRFSDDYFLARTFRKAGIEMSWLAECQMNWETGTMSDRCLRKKLSKVEAINPLSSLMLDDKGKQKDRTSGDWHTQLERYSICEASLRD